LLRAGGHELCPRQVPRSAPLQARQAPAEKASAVQEASPEATGSSRPSAPKASSKRPMIKMDQMVSTDGSMSMFECSLCSGVAWQPKVVMCCQKVFCGDCLDEFLLSSTACPQCHAAIVVRDGSTGSCTDQRVKKLERAASGVQGVLWRVYAGIGVRCVHNCSWTGSILSYSEHLESCSFENPKFASVEQRPKSQAISKASAHVNVKPTAQAPASPATRNFVEIM